jgi:hypothetical protein
MFNGGRTRKSVEILRHFCDMMIINLYPYMNVYRIYCRTKGACSPLILAKAGRFLLVKKSSEKNIVYVQII